MIRVLPRSMLAILKLCNLSTFPRRWDAHCRLLLLCSLVTPTGVRALVSASSTRTPYLGAGAKAALKGCWPR